VNLEALGAAVHRGEQVVPGDLRNAITAAMSTQSALDTAGLVPFLGPAVGGGTHPVNVLGLDLGRALLGGISCVWARPFRSGENVRTQVVVDKVFDRDSNCSGVVVAEFSGAESSLIQRQAGCAA
jgi:acyl dehydratase